MKTPIKVLGVVFAFLLIAVSAFAQDMKPEAGKLYNDGNQKLKNGDFAGAVVSYDSALAIEKDYRIYYQKGIALSKLNKIDDAKDAFEESLKVKPDFYAANNALGSVYFSLGDYQKAADNIEKYLTTVTDSTVKKAIQKNLSIAYAKLGDEANKKGDSKNAIDYFEKAVANSDYDVAYLSLAKVYTETNEWDKAISAAENAVKFRAKISTGGPYYYMGVA